jgi:hypothetical protein
MVVYDKSESNAMQLNDGRKRCPTEMEKVNCNIYLFEDLATDDSSVAAASWVILLLGMIIENKLQTNWPR